MAGLVDKIKNITSLLNKGGKKKTSTSPFSGNTDPFSIAPPGLGVVPDLKAGMPPGLASPPGVFPPGMQAQSEKPSVDTAALEASNKKIKELEGKLAKTDVSLSMVQKENEEMNKTVTKMDKNILELLSLYEIVSNQVNPFVGDDAGGRATIERFDKTEKRINEVGNMLVMLKNDIDSFSQRISSSGAADSVSEKMQDMETKFDAFADAMAMMHETINTISVKTEELSEKNALIDASILELSEVLSNLSLKVEDIEKNGAKIQKSPDQVSNSKEPIISEESNSNNQETSKGNNPLVRLDAIRKDPTSVVVLLNWIEFLMERVGRNNLMDALDYYVDIGWISDNVRSEIMAYARGIDYYVEKPTWRLLPEDHTKSLLFIERLCGRKIDKNMLSSIDREMSKVKHGLEELYGL
ncbi:FlaD/FlaE family flagellar protein [uncultured Methanomethylovorans sp.]|uniref:FlaD/FlaE family flagellar protein n=1 Tax=uncultured Methanomethylovorans sp. TaxID=183759 RepID=UPI002AA74498|nr:FlaD/FlaE family flagellar protein [uncultured Methanomethylovorans sp.]